MSQRGLSKLWMRAARRQMATLTRSALRAGSKLVKKAIKAPTPSARKSAALSGLPEMTRGIEGGRRYQLFRPPPTQHGAREPALVVMLHGCDQDAQSFAASTRMNRLARAQGFMVLYPEQERSANVYGCWSWFAIRTGKAQREAASVLNVVNKVCALHQVNPQRVVVAGMSAGGSMAALLALRYPSSFSAVVMHSGVAPGLATSTASALAAMAGRATGLRPALVCNAGTVPVLLVIQGTTDSVVVSANGTLAAERWAAIAHAKAGKPRIVQNGARYPVQITNWTVEGRTVATLMGVQGLGHAWSGGPASLAYTDPAGPDASRMVWAFAQRVFAERACIP
jgi:poly(hydroxyalkanoate) depolymerase family esterase